VVIEENGECVRAEGALGARQCRAVLTDRIMMKAGFGEMAKYFFLWHGGWRWKGRAVGDVGRPVSVV
jgi:hypothetical protein